MVTSRHSITARTVIAKSGMIVPMTVDQRTDLTFLPVALSVYHRVSGRNVAWETLTLVGDAMRDASAVIVQYVAADGEMTARCLWPTSISLTKDAEIVVSAYCTARRMWRTFRLARMVTCHALTTPDDWEAA